MTASGALGQARNRKRTKLDTLPSMNQRAELELVEALLRDWDPIGVIETLLEDGLPPNEYDSYAPHIRRTLADDDCTIEGLALTLELIRTRSMGLPECLDADRAAARRMIERWRARDESEGQ